jgi:polyhydroxyalkanoate synthase subunit PhaC
MTQEPDWAAAAQQWLQQFQSAALQWPGMPAQATQMPALSQLPHVEIAPEALRDIQQNYLSSVAALWNQGFSSQPLSDRRFKAEAWAANPVASFTAAQYLLNASTLMALVEALQTDEKTKAKIRFAAQQWVDATSPSNFMALNPEAQKKAIDSKGQSIAKGLQNMLTDIRQGHMSLTDETAFEVGKNVGTTEGAVVFENELFQLIEYKPLTAKVHEKPFLVVPPCINKFYILDLQPANSLVRYLVSQGHRTFVLSWRNADESIQDKTWDDYIEDAAICAIKKTAQLTGAKAKEGINALGFCVGGTILGTALAVLAARGEKPLASVTFLTTFLDFSNTGILSVFVDEAFVKYREAQIGQGGLLKGQELASTFSFLRPNDLVWNYHVGNYLKGETPPPFDLLYWNSDSTNLPGPMYTWYLRNTYHENNLVKPGKVTVCGQAIDFRKLDTPAYIYGSREDHIVPIGEGGGGAYGSVHILPGKKRFVMGASGHIAGVINPPAANKRSYWTNDKLPKTYEEWLKGSKEHPGSWWTDWSAWLKPHAGKLVAAPKKYAAKVIEPAPGSYVKARA